jgi:alpha-beta hydrolase superfamily lysophospholipase
LQDLEQVRDYLAGRGANRLFLVGSSMGGCVGAWFTRRHRDAVGACAYMAPSFSFFGGRWSRLGDAERQRWKETGRLRVRNEWVDVEIGPGLLEEASQFRTEDLIAGWSTPLLIFHGMRDEAVSYTESVDWIQQATFAEIELHLFKDGEHRLLQHKDEMAEAICRFFAPRWPAAES